MPRFDVDPGTRAALREQLQLVDQIAQAEDRALAAEARRQQAGANKGPGSEEDFKAKFRAEVAGLRGQAKAERAGLTARGVRMEMKDITEVLTGQIDPRSMHGALEAVERAAASAGAKSVQKYAAFGASMIPGIVAGAGLATAAREAVFGIMENAVSKESITIGEKARAQLKETLANEFRQSEAQREANVRRYSAMLEASLNATRPRYEMPSYSSFAWLKRLMMGEGLKAGLDRESPVQREFRAEAVERSRAAESVEFLKKAGYRGAMDGFSGQKLIPHIEDLLERGGDARAILRRMENLVAEIKEERKRENEQKIEAAEAAERETGGVRNSVLWMQRNAQLKAMETAQLERYNSWNPY